MKKITVKKAVSWNSCYSKDRIKELWAGRKHLTPLEILDLNIPPEDRLWAVLREEIIPAPYLRWLACHWAEQCLLHERAEGREPDPRSWKAVEVARLHAQSKVNDEELYAAEYAAWSAAEYAAEYAARSAAQSAAEYATYAAIIECVKVMLRWLDEQQLAEHEEGK
jgi:hypothetical protein